LAGKASARGSANSASVIIIRRDEGEEAPHHGGAWKVAYADFVTAMMAFFLLMWLLNATTEEQRTGLADYFAPTNLFGRAASGSGQPFGGKTPNDSGTSVSSDGAPQAIKGKQSPQEDVAESDTDTPAQPQPADSRDQADASQVGAGQGGAAQSGAGQIGVGQGSVGQGGVASEQPGVGSQARQHGGDYAAARLTPAQGRLAPGGNVAADPLRRETPVEDDGQREAHALEQAGAQLLDAVRRDPALGDAADQITVDSVPEGLRIQVVDAERRSMFALGGATPTTRVRDLMQKVVPVLAGLSNAISIADHTDGLTFRGQEMGNWELSSARANATRRILVEAGLPEGASAASPATPTATCWCPATR